jgi:hypothetical protein
MEPQIANDLIWKTIPGYENYEISNTGFVKNIKFGKMKKLNEIIMKYFINKRITIFKNGKRKVYYINKLLKELFTQEELNILPSSTKTTNEEELKNY